MESDRPDRLIGDATKLAYFWATLFPLALCIALMVYGCGAPVVNKPDHAAQFSKLAGLPIPDHERVIRTGGGDFFGPSVFIHFELPFCTSSTIFLSAKFFDSANRACT